MATAESYEATPPDERERYWAATDREQLAAEMHERIEEYYRFIEESGRLDLWTRATRVLYGLDADGGYKKSSAVTFGGEQGELAMLRINHFRSLVKGVHTLYTGQRPAWKVRAANETPEAAEQALVFNAITEQDMSEGRLEQCLKRVAWYAGHLGEGWLYQTWDPNVGDPVDVDPMTGRMARAGDVRTKAMRPIDVVRDIEAPFDEETGGPEWVIVRHRINRWKLAATYPDYHDEIMGLPAAGEDADESSTWKSRSTRVSKDVVYVYELLHPETAALSGGRWALLAGDCVLVEGPYAFDDLTCIPMIPDFEDDRPFGYASAWDLLAPQEAYDAVLSTAQTNVDSHGVQSIWTKKGDDLSTKMLARGMRHLQSDEPPQAVQLTRVAEDAWKLGEVLRKEMETLIGFSSLGRGAPSAENKSGASLAMIHSVTVQFNSDMQAAYGQVCELAMNVRLRLYKKFAAQDRVVEMVGDDVGVVVKRWNANTLKGVAKVVVEMAAPETVTSHGRLEQADKMAERGWLKGPEEYEQVRTTGRLEPALKRERNETRLIAAENDAMRRGEVPPVLKWHHHLIHYTEHAAAMNSPEVLQNPAMLNALIEHNNWHLELLYKLAVTAPWVLEAGGIPIPATLQGVASMAASQGMAAPDAGTPIPGDMGVPPGAGGGPMPPEGQADVGAAVPAINQQPNPEGANARLPQMPKNPITGERVPAPAAGPIPTEG